MCRDDCGVYNRRVLKFFFFFLSRAWIVKTVYKAKYHNILETRIENVRMFNNNNIISSLYT